MNVQKNRLPLAAALLVVLGGLTAWLFYSREAQEADAGDPSATLPKVDKTKLIEIEIQRPAEPAIRLTKKGQSWVLTAPLEAETETSAVTSAVDALAELEVHGIAATKKENHKLLEVDDAHGVRVIAKEKERTVLDIVVGAYRGNNTMVRIEGKDLVLAAGGSLKYTFNKAVKDWRQRKIADLKTEELTSLKLQSSAGAFEFSQAENVWKLATGQKAIPRFDASKVQSLAASLSSLRAIDFADANVDKTKAGLDTPQATVVLTAAAEAGTNQVVLSLGKESKEPALGYYAMRSDKPTIYIVSKYLGDQMKPTAATFQASADAGAPAPPTEGANFGATPQAMDPSQIPPDVMEKLRAQMQNQGAP